MRGRGLQIEAMVRRPWISSRFVGRRNETLTSLHLRRRDAWTQLSCNRKLLFIRIVRSCLHVYATASRYMGCSAFFRERTGITIRRVALRLVRRTVFPPNVLNRPAVPRQTGSQIASTLRQRQFASLLDEDRSHDKFSIRVMAASPNCAASIKWPRFSSSCASAPKAAMEVAILELADEASSARW